MTATDVLGHVVIVDSNYNLCSKLHDLLHDRNYRVSIYSSPEPAIEGLHKNGKSWDVVLIDFHLFETVGMSFTKCIKEVSDNLPIILTKDSSTVSDLSSGHRPNLSASNPPLLNLDPAQFPQLLTELENIIASHQNPHVRATAFKHIQRTKRSQTEIIGTSSVFRQALETAQRVAHSQANVFISGESGTGKEVFAKFIHEHSRHADGAFVAINCSAIPENLLESELFGHAKGAFTGAIDKKVGLFEEAENGTLFLDEIGDLSLSLQAKLLRVLQEKVIKRVGENSFRPINARIISATHKDLGKEVAAGLFREDLFYRLGVIPLIIPPLRERREDILPLAHRFLTRCCRENELPMKHFSEDAEAFLVNHNWRGNIRELENAIERAVVLTLNPQLTRLDFAPSIIDPPSVGPPELAANSDVNHRFVLAFDQMLPSLEETIQKYIEFAVNYNHGAKDRTAKDIGIDRKTLYRRLNPSGGHL